MVFFSRQQNISPGGKEKVALHVFFLPSGKCLTRRKKRSCARCFPFPSGKNIAQAEKGKLHRMFFISGRRDIGPDGKTKVAPHVFHFRPARYWTRRKKRKVAPHVFHFRPARYWTRRKNESCAACFSFPAGEILDQAEKRKLRRMFFISGRRDIGPGGKTKVAADVFHFRPVRYWTRWKNESCAARFAFPADEIFYRTEKGKFRRMFYFPGDSPIFAPFFLYIVERGLYLSRKPQSQSGVVEEFHEIVIRSCSICRVYGGQSIDRRYIQPIGTATRG